MLHTKKYPRVNEGQEKKSIMNILPQCAISGNSHKNLDALILASNNNFCQGVYSQNPYISYVYWCWPNVNISFFIANILNKEEKHDFH